MFKKGEMEDWVEFGWGLFIDSIELIVLELRIGDLVFGSLSNEEGGKRVRFSWMEEILFEVVLCVLRCIIPIFFIPVRLQAAAVTLWH